MKLHFLHLAHFTFFLTCALRLAPCAFGQPANDIPLKIKVAVVVQDPSLPQYGGKKMHEVVKTPGRTFMWNDPRELSKEYEAALEKISHGTIQYEVVKIIDDTLLFSNRNDNNQPVGITDMVRLLMEPDWKTLKGIGTHFDYKRFVEHYGFDKMRDRDEINEVWVWSFPYGGMWESNYCGKTGFWLNSDPTTTTTNEKLLVVMGLNYERKMSLALESYGHRFESVIWHLYGRWDYKGENPNNWEKFSRFEKTNPGLANIGNIHFPPNGDHDYDWVNKTPVTTCADGWNYYPDIKSDMTRTVDCSEWQCSHEGYMRWWFSHIPHFAGINAADGHLNNWWRYVVNWEEAVSRENVKIVKNGKNVKIDDGTRRDACNASHHDNSLRIGFISNGGGAEQKAAFEFLKGQTGIQAEEVRGEEVKGLDRRGLGVVWYHKPDTLLTAWDTSVQTISALKKYVEAGGNLFLSLDAVRLLPYLGVEKSAPRVNYVELKDEGNGRKLGLHGFRSHPVFDGLLGGVYSYAPKTDVKVRRVGWFGNELPQGKVVAVDWAYIFIYEDSKLITEYNLGKGKILAAGAYLYYNQSNFNRAHLEKFTANVFSYLSGKRSEIPVRFWDFEPGKVTASEFSTPDIMRGVPVKWELSANPIALANPRGAKNMWDISGERMVLMGKEGGGIDEVWAHPFMAIRDYEISLKFEGNPKSYRLNELTPKIEVGPESFIRTYQIDSKIIKEVIVCHPTDGTAVIHYEYTGAEPAALIISFKSNLRFMWPYSEKVTGAIKYGWDKGLNGWVIQNKAGDFISVIGINRTAGDQKATIGDGLIIGAGMSVTLRGSETLDVVLAASATGLTEAISAYRRAMLDPKAVYLAAATNAKSLFDGKLNISGPDEEFNTGFKWAVAGTDKFIVNTPGVGRSLVAGYATSDYGWKGGHKVNGRPGYAWYFGRDAVWSSFAVLDYGDFDRVKTVLELFSRYQDISGKIYHELTTSGIAHYDAADATPLYIALAGKYLHHSGDTALIRKEWPAIKKAIDFCFTTDTDGDHLIENTQQGHGWEEGGDLYVTHTTQYMVSCWAEALNQAAYMAEHIGLPDLARKYADEAAIVLDKLNNGFWNPETMFFNHGLFKDGTYLAEPSVMTAIPVYWGQIKTWSRARSVVEQLASCNFTTDWGTRIVSEKAKFFAPGGYHTGSVWPLFTGWAALGDYAAGNPAQGFSKMMSNLLVYEYWSLGYIEEVLHGTQYKYFGVCRHQAWSETMVLQPAIEGMLGLKPDAMKNTVSLSLDFPLDWDSVSVDNIRMGDHLLNLEMRRAPEKVIVSIDNRSDRPGPLVDLRIPVLAGAVFEGVWINGQPPEKFWTGEHFIRVALTATGINTVEIRYHGGMSVLPLVHHPAPGDSSTGLKIISDQLIGNKYLVKVEGLSGTTGKIRLSESGTVTEKDFVFPESEEKYLLKDLVFYNGKPENEVFYYVLLRSFYDSNGDGQGDLNGLRSKLDYLQELGITSILMLPLYQSDFYHNYFATDYQKIDPEYGTMDDLIALIREVHRRGMKIYLDMETQYVTEGSDWYTQHPEYQIQGTPWGKLLSYDGSSKGMNMANVYNPEVSEYFHKLYHFFMDPNQDGRYDDSVDGFRIDHIMDDLDNAGKLTNLYAGYWKPLFDDLRQTNPRIRIIGEQADWADFGGDLFSKADLDFVFAFQNAMAIKSMNKNLIINKINSTISLTPGNKDQLIFIENHDLDRFATGMSGSLAKEKIGAAFNLLLKGIPLIYYGQELGMKGVKYGGKNDGNDIPRREAFEWYRSTEGPGMAHWYKNSGPWWDNRNGKTGDGISLEEARTDKNSLWNFYKKLISIRGENPAITGGDLNFIPNDNPSVVSFVRTLEQKKVLVVINLTGKPQTVQLGDQVPASNAKVLVSEPAGCTTGSGAVKMKKFGIFVAQF
ncbi:MAG: alpha-amylase family glycosyl hydrolase [Bacteroidales bacterium]